MAHRNRAVLHDRTDAHGELPLASVTAPQEAGVPRSVLRLHLRYVHVTATRAGGLTVPTLFLHEGDSRRFIGASKWDASY
jgi:hypothetical protein